MQTNVKLECKRADADMEKLRKTLDEEKQKLKAEQEVGYRALFSGPSSGAFLRGLGKGLEMLATLSGGHLSLTVVSSVQRHHSIVEECKVLKKELVQLKMAHNRERKR